MCVEEGLGLRWNHERNKQYPCGQNNDTASFPIFPCISPRSPNLCKTQTPPLPQRQRIMITNNQHSPSKSSTHRLLLRQELKHPPMFTLMAKTIPVQTKTFTIPLSIFFPLLDNYLPHAKTKISDMPIQTEPHQTSCSSHSHSVPRRHSFRTRRDVFLAAV